MTKKEKKDFENIEEIDILLVTFNRLHLLKRTVKKIYERTRYPHGLWVIDNNSTDGTKSWLKKAKLHGYLYDYILKEKNDGLASALTKGFEKVKSEYFITTQDDVIPPDLKPCWLERMLHIAEKNPDYAGLSMRIQRIRHRDVNEKKELIESPKSLASVYRIQKKSDIEKVKGFGHRSHWESTDFVNRTKNLKKKYAVITHLYADHIGFMPDNKGFKDGFTSYHTYAKERIKQGKDQPYPDIDPKTNIPLKINTSRDRHEQGRREKLWEYWGADSRKTKRKTNDQKILAEYAKEGRGIEIGPGRVKSHENAIGVDVFPYKTADILGSAEDLWMFRDNELDFVIASHSLEHFPDTKQVLKEWKRVLKDGGIIAVAVPDGEKRPNSIKGSHKVVLTKEILRVIFKFELNMRVIKIMDVPGKKRGKESIIVVAKK
jgi:glycosyltransferase involved in cell wall biosynthesis